jgi:hypothetical protein
MSTIYPLLATAAAALMLWLTYRLVRASHARTQARAAYLEAVKPLFDSSQTQLQPTGFPRMAGRKGTLTFDLQVVPDSLTFRKLPALWVLVTLTEPQPVAATLDLLSRPSGQEPFTRFATLPQTIATPAALPKTVAIRTDDATRIPPADLITRHAALFDDPLVKELVISPKGLRLVILGEEADRGPYLLFREAELGMTPLAPGRLQPLLDRLAALRDDLLAQPKATP